MSTSWSANSLSTKCSNYTVRHFIVYVIIVDFSRGGKQEEQREKSRES